MKTEKQEKIDSSGISREKITDPQEITLYGKGAGLYSYLNALAQMPASFDQKPFELKQ